MPNKNLKGDKGFLLEKAERRGWDSNPRSAKCGDRYWGCIAVILDTAKGIPIVTLARVYIGNNGCMTGNPVWSETKPTIGFWESNCLVT